MKDYNYNNSQYMVKAFVSYCEAKSCELTIENLQKYLREHELISNAVKSLIELSNCEFVDDEEYYAIESLLAIQLLKEWEHIFSILDKSYNNFKKNQSKLQTGKKEAQKVKEQKKENDCEA